MYLAKLKRTSFEKKQTLGELEIFFKGKSMFKCKTLELADLNNEKRKSCIPAGTYDVAKRNSAKYGDHFQVLNVPDRDYILIHHGNYHTDILGCILVGKTHQDINGDDCKDVTSSKVTMKELNKQLPKSFTLEIENRCSPSTS